MDDLNVTAGSGATFTVHNPMGYPPKLKKRETAPRLDTLDGKVVYLVDCRFDDAVELLKQVQAWFNDKMRSVDARIISINNTYQKDDPETWKEIQAKGDAAIIGVGH